MLYQPQWIGLDFPFTPETAQRAIAFLERHAEGRGVTLDITDASLVGNDDIIFARDYDSADQAIARLQWMLAGGDPTKPGGDTRYALDPDFERKHPRAPEGTPTGGKFIEKPGDEDDEDRSEFDSLPSEKVLLAAKPDLAKVAQEEYDQWDESNVDEYAEGGICHLIADRMADVLNGRGIEASTVSAQIGKQHVWVVARTSDGVYTVDIPPGVYETGGGYHWKKIPDVTFEAGDVVIDRLSRDPGDFDQYLDYALDPEFERKHPRAPEGTPQGGKWIDTPGEAEDEDEPPTSYPVRGEDPPEGYIRVFRGINPERNRIAGKDDTHGFWFTTAYDDAVGYANWDYEGTGELGPGRAIVAVDIREDVAFEAAQSGSRRHIADVDELYDTERPVELLLDLADARNATFYEGDLEAARAGVVRGAKLQYATDPDFERKHPRAPQGTLEGGTWIEKPGTDVAPPAFRPVSAEDFVAARDRSGRPGFLSASGPADLKDHRLYTTADGAVGYALDRQGDIQNVFNNGGPKGSGTEAMLSAILRGGRTLDCYDGFLPSFYSQFGFVETGRMKFNPEYAHGWDTAKYDSPDVVFMAWKGFPVAPDTIRTRLRDKQNWRKHDSATNYYAGQDWDTAKADSRRAARSGPDRERPGGRVGGAERRPDSGAGQSVGRAIAAHAQDPAFERKHPRGPGGRWVTVGGVEYEVRPNPFKRESPDVALWANDAMVTNYHPTVEGAMEELQKTQKEIEAAAIRRANLARALDQVKLGRATSDDHQAILLMYPHRGADLYEGGAMGILRDALGLRPMEARRRLRHGVRGGGLDAAGRNLYPLVDVLALVRQQAVKAHAVDPDFETKHPRAPKGTAKGGKFIEKPEGVADDELVVGPKGKRGIWHVIDGEQAFVPVREGEPFEKAIARRRHAMRVHRWEQENKTRRHEVRAAHEARKAAGLVVPRAKKPAEAPAEPRVAPVAGAYPEETTLTSSGVSSVKKLGGGVSDSRVVTFVNGEKAVFKLPLEKSIRRNIPVGGDTAREAAAWEVAKLVGMTDMVPATIVRTINGERGSLQGFVKNAEVAHEVRGDRKYDGETDLRRAAIFDLMVGNTDRHEGNWMIKRSSDKLALIDNGLAFPNEKKVRGLRSGFLSPASHLKLTDADRKSWGTALPKMAAKLRAVGLDEASIQGFEGRVNYLLRPEIRTVSDLMQKVSAGGYW
jgi:hypothetical protein